LQFSWLNFIFSQKGFHQIIFIIPRKIHESSKKNKKKKGYILNNFSLDIASKLEERKKSGKINLFELNLMNYFQIFFLSFFLPSRNPN